MEINRLNTERQLPLSIIIGDIDDQGGRLRLKDINDTSCVKIASGYGTGDITNTFSSGMSNTSYVMTVSGGYVNDDGMHR